MKRIIFFILSFNMALVSVVYAQEEPAETSSTLILNVYLEENGKALVIGYLETQEMLSGLPFIDKSEYIFQNDTNQLYAITDSLTSKQEEKWTFNFSLEGYYTEYAVIFYFPPETAITNIDISKDLSYFLTTENNSILLSTQGFEVDSPSVFLNYQQFMELGERYPKTNYIYVLFLAGISFSLFVLLILFALLPRKKRKVQIEKKEIQPTSEMQKVIETLSENEKAIVDTLLRGEGSLLKRRFAAKQGFQSHHSRES